MTRTRFWDDEDWLADNVPECWRLHDAGAYADEENEDRLYQMWASETAPEMTPEAG